MQQRKCWNVFWLLFSITLLGGGCNSKTQEKPAKEPKVNQYSTQFELFQLKDGVRIIFPNKMELVIQDDTLYSEDKLYPLNQLNFALASSTHAGYLQELNELSRMKAIGTPFAYIVDSVLKNSIEKRNVPEFMSGADLDAELLLQEKVNVLCYYPFGFSKNALLDASDIIQIPVAEYLESHPLGQLEWLYVFGAMTGKFDQAVKVVAERVKAYEEVKKHVQKQKVRYFLDVPFKGEWHMAPANSSRVQMMADLGMEYYFSDQEADKNIVVSVDEMLLNSDSSDVWIIQTAVTTSLEDLIKDRDEHLLNLPSYKAGNVYFCNTLESPIFETGYNVHPEKVLQDIYEVIILQNEAYSPYFYQKLEY